MNMFDMGMFGMMPPEERKKILMGGDLHTATDKPRHKGFFWANRDPNKKRSSLEDFNIMNMGEGTGVLDEKNKLSQITSTQSAQATGTKFDPSQGNPNFKFRPDEKTGKSLAENWLGMDFDLLKKNWKNKGGFEGLMANPAFTLGLSIMQSSAQGKRIDSALMDNFIKSAGISEHFADRMRARSAVIGLPDESERQLVEDVMEGHGFDRQWAVRNLFGDEQNTDANWRELQETVYQKTMERLKKEAGPGKEVALSRAEIRKTFNQMKGKELKVIKRWLPRWLGGRDEIQYTTPDKNRVQGGPVAKGQSYVVGEGGPEYFLPQESGKVLSNDDSRIFTMLLSANPQLQNVSRTRAEKILRNRFPEYFE
jgi:hypothetical protein